MPQLLPKNKATRTEISGENVRKRVDTPLVTVIIPVRNGEKFIVQAIESILSQTLKELELLVVDDASTDHTLEVIRPITDPRLRILCNRNRLGVSASRNIALAQASSPYVAFLDADDVSYPTRLERQVLFLQNHPTVALVGCHVDYIDSEGAVLFSEQPGHRKLESRDIRSELLNRACILPSTATGRKEALLRVGGFAKGDYAEDHDLWCRLSLAYDLAVMPDRLVAYRHHSGQATFRKIRQAYAGTRNCVERARQSFVAAGVISAKELPPALTMIDKLRGENNSLGAIYTEWAALYSWAFRMPRQALGLASMALLCSPLNLKAWSIWIRSVGATVISPKSARALNWYGKKIRRLLSGNICA